MRTFWERYRETVARLFGALRPQHGVPEEEVRAAEQRLGLRLPVTLAEFYRQTGNHQLINGAHNRLVPLSKLLLSAGFLIFFEENQWVSLWGIPEKDLSAVDPAVHQGTSIQDKQQREWSLESERLSDFLLKMLCWQAVMGGLPNFGNAMLTKEQTLHLQQHWPIVVAEPHSNMQAFSKDDQVVCLFQQGQADQAYAAARTVQGFAGLEKELRIIEWDYAEVTEGGSE